MRRTLNYILLAGTFLLASCGKQIPDNIIQPQKMENVLYDYHLASGMSVRQLNVEKEAYKQHVFQKHGITRAEFDSSMVWYTRNAKYLSDIYNNLSQRFKEEDERMQMHIAEQGSGEQTFESGDSVDIWNYPTIQWLSRTPLNDLLKFEIKPDSTFHDKDAFSWSANYTFLAEGKAVMGMSLIFENDSVAGRTLTVSRSGKQSIELQPDTAYRLKSINGFIHVQSDSTQSASILLNELSLMRYHPTDSTASSKPILPKDDAKENAQP